jgi:RHS repeat-associated protein
VWLGSLTEDNENASGSLYRRNRYLDPTSGQFTQEDPIGLAGGLNLYGFASGDPVTFNDPFGLKADSSVFTRAWSELKAGVRQWWRDATDMGQAEDFLDAAAFLPVIGVAGRAAGAAEEASAARGLIDRIAAKLTRIASHLKRSDLSGAAQELRGVPTGFDHVTEVRDAAQGMRNQIARLNRLLGNPNLSAENRGPLEALLGRASRALDAAERALRQ